MWNEKGKVLEVLEVLWWWPWVVALVVAVELVSECGISSMNFIFYFP